MRKNFSEKNVKYFNQIFADWSDEDGISWVHLKDDAPQLHHVQNIITFLKPFVKDEQQHNLGVNCFAGISRSTAVGIIALVMSGRSVEQALAEILQVRNIAWPNIRILGFASQIIGMDLKTPVVKWKNCSLDEGIWMPDRMQPTK